MPLDARTVRAIHCRPGAQEVLHVRSTPLYPASRQPGRDPSIAL